MYKEVNGFAALIKKPYRICFLIAGVFLFFALTSFHSSVLIKDYIEAVGEISDVEEVSVYWHQQYVTRYNYRLTWMSDDEEHEKYFEEQMDFPEEGEVTIWVRPDNQDAVLSNVVEVNESAYEYLGIGLAAGLLGFIILFIWNLSHPLTREQKEEQLEDTKLYSVLVFILCIIGIIIQVSMSYLDYRNGEYVDPVLYDFSIVCGVIALICVILFIRAKIKLKKAGL